MRAIQNVVFLLGVVFIHQRHCHTLRNANGQSEESSLSSEALPDSWAKLAADLNQLIRLNVSDDELIQDPVYHPEFCGTTPGLAISSLRRIVGGEDAEEGSAPWQVGLILMEDEKETYSSPKIVCGGTLLTSHAFVTAAHCINKKARYEAMVGRKNSDLYRMEPFSQRLKVEDCVVHPGFVSRLWRNDIAVCSVLSEYGQGVQFSHFVIPACLGRAKDMYKAKSKATITGWGYLEENGPLKRVNLQEATVEIFSDDSCYQAYSPKIQMDMSTQFCAGYKEGGRDACAGDSGGPITTSVRFNNTQRYFVSGAVSFGLGCARKRYPGVYTRIEHYIPWIVETAASLTGSAESQCNSVESVQKPDRHSYHNTADRATTTPTTTSTTTATTTVTLKMETIKVGPVCSGTYRWLVCSQVSVIKIISVFMGRRSLLACNDDLGQRGASSSFPSHELCENTNAFVDLRRFCEGKRYCYVNTNTNNQNGPFYDHQCQNKRPYVEVEYACVSSLEGQSG